MLSHQLCGVLSVLVIGGGAGCGESFAVSDQNLSGTAFGADWVFVTGETSAFLSEGEDDFFSSLYGEDHEACGFGGPSGPELLGGVPKVAGEYELDFPERTFTFAMGGDNLIATEGVIVVEEVTETTVTGGLHIKYDDDNEVDGNFELTICVD